MVVVLVLVLVLVAVLVLVLALASLALALAMMLVHLAHAYCPPIQHLPQPWPRSRTWMCALGT
jgi:hypothetical protein